MFGTKRILLPGLSLLALVIACGSRASKREEACQRTSDCEGNLVCMAISGGGVCRPVDYNIQPTNKECAAVQCTSPDDCCATFTPPGACTTWNQQCMMDPMMYMTACDNYQKFCICDKTKYACLNDKCVISSTCMMDTDCPGSAPHCSSGQCVQCLMNSDCPNNGVCYNGACNAGCQGDGDCPIFYGCKASVCTKVGCLSDRECIVYEDNPLGFCDTATKACSVQCDKDVQCNTGSGPIKICQSGKCIDAGCESDDECKAVLSPLPKGSRAVCRAKKS